MAHTQMTDRNPSELGLMEELTDRELLAINGGVFSSRPFTPLPPMQPIRRPIQPMPPMPTSPLPDRVFYRDNRNRRR
jgi:hypothetical protein